MDKKIINEMNTAAGAMGSASNFFRVRRNRKGKPGFPFTEAATITTKVNTKKVAVYPKDKSKREEKKGKKDSLPYKVAQLESKSEKVLRESIRNLIFLSRIKYHEEQAKIGIQEQKLRKIIQHLLKEEKNDQIYLTTGENNAADFLNNIRSTTFDQLYAKLSSSEQQRLAFRTTYLEKLKLYLDSLDQQYIIINPEDKPTKPLGIEKPEEGNEPNQAELETGSPEMETPPEETPPEMGATEEPDTEEVPPEGAEQPEEEPLQEAAGGVPPVVGISQMPDTSRLQKQVIATQLNKPDLDTTGIKQAIKALTKDLPQIDDLYSSLTFKPLRLPTGEVTSDREIFRKMLFGGPAPDGSNLDGNLDIRFDGKDKDVITSDKPAATPAANAAPNPDMGAAATSATGV